MTGEGGARLCLVFSRILYFHTIIPLGDKRRLAVLIRHQRSGTCVPSLSSRRFSKILAEEAACCRGVFEVAFRHPFQLHFKGSLPQVWVFPHIKTQPATGGRENLSPRNKSVEAHGKARTVREISQWEAARARAHLLKSAAGK